MKKLTETWRQQKTVSGIKIPTSKLVSQNDTTCNGVGDIGKSGARKRLGRIPIFTDNQSFKPPYRSNVAQSGESGKVTSSYGESNRASSRNGENGRASWEQGENSRTTLKQMENCRTSPKQVENSKNFSMPEEISFMSSFSTELDTEMLNAVDKMESDFKMSSSSDKRKKRISSSKKSDTPKMKAQLQFETPKQSNSKRMKECSPSSPSVIAQKKLCVGKITKHSSECSVNITESMMTRSASRKKAVHSNNAGKENTRYKDSTGHKSKISLNSDLHVGDAQNVSWSSPHVTSTPQDTPTLPNGKQGKKVGKKQTNLFKSLFTLQSPLNMSELDQSLEIPERVVESEKEERVKMMGKCMENSILHNKSPSISLSVGPITVSKMNVNEECQQKEKFSEQKPDSERKLEREITASVQVSQIHRELDNTDDNMPRHDEVIRDDMPRHDEVIRDDMPRHDEVIRDDMPRHDEVIRDDMPRHDEVIRDDMPRHHEVIRDDMQRNVGDKDGLRLCNWGLPEPVLKQYHDKGITMMFPWQVECLCTAQGKVLGGGNLVYSAPTSAGKTMVAEMLVLKRVMETKKKAIIILPFVSVAREKTIHLQQMYQDAGIRVGGFMGSHSPAGGFMNVDVAVCTIEKGNSLINRLLEENKLDQLGIIVVDELHLVGDSHRGYLLELLLTKIRYVMKKEEEKHSKRPQSNSLEHNVQIVGMSATLPNLDLLARWLNAELYHTEFRPVPLTECVKIGAAIYDSSLVKVRDINLSLTFKMDEDHVIPLCLEMLRKGHSTLIFCPTKNWCEKLCETIARELYGILRKEAEDNRKGSTDCVDPGQMFSLNRQSLLDVVEQLRRTPVGLDSMLGKTVPYGVAYHHAGLTFDERDIVEGAFRQGILKVLVATSTLSSGVNLPARRVIIRTPTFHGKIIDFLTYKQMIGRAGRKGVDTEGESILICKSNERTKAVTLVTSELPPVGSCLSFKEGEPLSRSLKRAILEIVVSGVATVPADVATYVSCTMLAASLPDDTDQTQALINACLQFMEENEFVSLQKIKQPDGSEIERFSPTQLGAAVLASSLSPDEGLTVFAELEKARQCFVLENELHIIYLVTPIYSMDLGSSMDWYQFYYQWEKLTPGQMRVAELVGISEGFITKAIRGKIPTKTASQLRTLAIHKRFWTALMLHDLVHEMPLNEVARKYSCNKGQLQSLQQSAATFAGMVTVFCARLGWCNLELILGQFQNRLTFGIQRELCDLVRLTLLNGQRARVLYNGGYQTIAALANASPSDVEAIFKNAAPFQSGKRQENESEWEAAQRRESRCIWLTGRKGVTELEAALAIIEEAKGLIQDELGGLGIQWRNPTDNQSLSDKTGDISTVTNHSSITDSRSFIRNRSGLIRPIRERGKTRLSKGGKSSPSGESGNVSTAVVVEGTDKKIVVVSPPNLKGKDGKDSEQGKAGFPNKSADGNVDKQVKGGQDFDKLLNEEQNVVTQSNVNQKKDKPLNENQDVALIKSKSENIKETNITRNLEVNFEECLLNKEMNDMNGCISDSCQEARGGNIQNKLFSQTEALLDTQTEELFQDDLDCDDLAIVDKDMRDSCINDIRLATEHEEKKRVESKQKAPVFKIDDGLDDTLNICDISCDILDLNLNDSKKNVIKSNEHSGNEESVKNNLKPSQTSNTCDVMGSLRNNENDKDESKMFLVPSIIKPKSPEEFNDSFVLDTQTVNIVSNRRSIENTSPVLYSEDINIVNENIVDVVKKNVCDHPVEKEISYDSTHNATADLIVASNYDRDVYGTEESEADDTYRDLHIPYLSGQEECFGKNIQVVENVDQEKKSYGQFQDDLVKALEMDDTFNYTLDSKEKVKGTGKENVKKVNKIITEEMNDSLTLSVIENMLVDDHSSSVKNTADKYRNNDAGISGLDSKRTPKGMCMKKNIDDKKHSICQLSPGTIAFLDDLNTCTVSSNKSRPRGNGMQTNGNDTSPLKPSLRGKIVQSRSTETSSSSASPRQERAQSDTSPGPEKEQSNKSPRGKVEQTISTVLMPMTTLPRRKGLQTNKNDVELSNASESERRRKRHSDESEKSFDSVKQKRSDKDPEMSPHNESGDFLPPTPPAEKTCNSPLLTFKKMTPKINKSNKTTCTKTCVTEINKSEKHCPESVAIDIEKSLEENYEGRTPVIDPNESGIPPSESCFTIIDVCADKKLFQTFIKEWGTQTSYSISLACEKKAPLPVTDRGIGGNFLENAGMKPLTTVPGNDGIDVEGMDIIIVGMAVCWENRDAYFIAFTTNMTHCELDDSLAPPPLDASISVQDRLTAVQAVLEQGLYEHEVVTISVFDCKRTYSALVRGCGISMRGRFQDPKVACWLQDPGAKEKNLHRMVHNYLPMEADMLDDIGGGIGVSSLGMTPQNPGSGRYRATTESVLTLHLMEYFTQCLHKEGLFNAFQKVEMPSIISLVHMELNGFGFSEGECGNLKDMMLARLNALEEEAYQAAGHPFSLTATDDIAQVLFIELQLPPDGDTTNLGQRRPLRKQQVAGRKGRQKSQFSTSKDVLEKLRNLHPLPGIILEWRRISGTLTKVVFPLQEEKVHISGLDMYRIFTECQVHTATGRVSLSEPNLQNVPKDFDISIPDIIGESPPINTVTPGTKQRGGKSRLKQMIGTSSRLTCQSKDTRPQSFSVSMRNAFVPFKGGVILAADYSQLELRMIAHLSKDAKLIRILNEDGDVFKLIAAQWKCTSPENVTSEQRQQAKQVCYGMIYGISSKALGEQLEVEENDAAAFIETFKAKYPGMRAFLKDTVNICREKGYVQTILGRRRYLPTITSTNPYVRAHAERQAVNTTVQGSAADLVKIAMNNIDVKLSDQFPHSSVHHRQKRTGSSGGLYRPPPGCFLVLQLHDELIYEVAQDCLVQASEIIKYEMEHAMTFPVKMPIKIQAGPSWGKLQTIDL